MTESSYLRIAIGWCCNGLRQAERVRASFDDYRASLFPAGPEVPESERPRYHLWGDIHFLILSVHHLMKALDKLPPVPLFPKSDKVKHFRDLLEHWEAAPDAR
ncbi:MAG TPA: hypothetical protein VI094_08420 [Propionibacteriaceae bacterium]